MRSLRVMLVVVLGVLAACSSDGSGGAAGRDAGGTATTVAGGEASGCGAGSGVSPGAERLQVDEEGRARTVERVIPPAYDGQQPLPLIVSLHGFTSNIEQQDLFSDLPEAAAERGYVLLTPQGEDVTVQINGQEITAPFWNVRPDDTEGVTGARDDIGFLSRLIDATIDELCIDPARVYVTGNSNGAGMAATLACAMPGRIAAIAPVSGINLAAPCPDLDPVSVVAFHGDADPLVPYEGESTVGVELGNASVEEAVGAFAAAAGCDDQPSSDVPFPDVTVWQWSGCEPGLDVELYTVLGGGHTWPGMLNYVDAEQLQQLAQGMDLPRLANVDIGAIAGHMTTNVEATSVMLDFFDEHRLSL